MSAESPAIDAQIDELTDKMGELSDQAKARSASRVARELKRVATGNQRIIPLLHANHCLMNDAQSLFEPEYGADLAVETIALLESEEKARQVQPEFPQEHYDYMVSQLSACAYDNLAKHVAEREGYNSDGVHNCINEGILVCRRTGKLECITCFREYATDVYKASDDVEMALHHARAVSNHPVHEDSPVDRRWVGARDAAQLLLLNGQLDAALETALQAWSLVDTYHTPASARFETERLIESILLMSGRPAELQPTLEARPIKQPSVEIVEGESIRLDIIAAQCRAIGACCAGDYSRAIEILTHWDRWLMEHKCLSTWFEIRLRLIATYQLAGQTSRLDALTAQLESKAKPARDWLSLRRLKGVMDGSVHPSPLALLASLAKGPFAAPQPSVSVEPAAEPVAETEALPAQPETSENDEQTSVPPDIESIYNRLQQAEGDQQTYRDLFVEIVSREPGNVQDPDTARYLVHLASMLSGFSESAAPVWQWAEALLSKFPQDAILINVTANLGYALVGEAEEADDGLPSLDRIESLFRESLDLDSHRAKNFARAGEFYLDQNQVGEAERCLARAFRLDRSEGRIATRLADIYAGTDRVQDALNTLDMCLREGCQDPPVLWQAAMTALTAEKFASVLTYLDRYTQLVDDEPWVNYYRAIALLETGQADQAEQALERESELNPECPFMVAALRCCVAGLKQDRELLNLRLKDVFPVALSSVDYLTESGLANLFERVSQAVQILDVDDPARQRFESLALASGFAPDDYFQRFRDQGELQEGLNYYVCQVVQPLDDDWAEHAGCLCGQQSWDRYLANWGVLAADEEKACQAVKAWQAKCYTAPPASIEAFLQGEDFQDIPGVVWQGTHEPVEEDRDGNGDVDED